MICRTRLRTFFRMVGEQDPGLKDGYLDISHLTKLKNIYITEICMGKQYKSSIIKNHKTIEKDFFEGIPLKSYVAFYAIYRFLFQR